MSPGTTPLTIWRPSSSKPLAEERGALRGAAQQRRESTSGATPEGRMAAAGGRRRHLDGTRRVCAAGAPLSDLLPGVGSPVPVRHGFAIGPKAQMIGRGPGNRCRLGMAMLIRQQFRWSSMIPAVVLSQLGTGAHPAVLGVWPRRLLSSLALARGSRCSRSGTGGRCGCDEGGVDDNVRKVVAG